MASTPFRLPPLIVPSSWPQTPHSTYSRANSTNLKKMSLDSASLDQAESEDGLSPDLSQHSSPQDLTPDVGLTALCLADDAQSCLNHVGQGLVAVPRGTLFDNGSPNSREESQMQDVVVSLPPKLRSSYGANISSGGRPLPPAAGHRHCWAHMSEDLGHGAPSRPQVKEGPVNCPMPDRIIPAVSVADVEKPLSSSEDATEKPAHLPSIRRLIFQSPSLVTMSIHNHDHMHLDSTGSPSNDGIKVMSFTPEAARSPIAESSVRVRKTSLSNLIHNHQKGLTPPALVGVNSPPLYTAVAKNTKNTKVPKSWAMDDTEWRPVPRTSVNRERRPASGDGPGRPTKHAIYMLKPNDTPAPFANDACCKPMQIGKRWKCNECPLDFNRRADCNRHFQSTHVFASHKCGLCEKVFTRSDAKVRHLRAIHNVS